MTSPIFFDESGYTGRQLLDPLQKHFVLVSTSVNESLAEDILRTSFPSYQGAEFKFEKIWAKPRSRGRLGAFARTVGRSSEHFYIWHIDKRFTLLVKMLEYLMEPIAYEAGFDWYSGYGPKLCNYVYFGLTNIAEESVCDNTLSAYYKFAYKPTEEGRLRLISELIEIRSKAPQELKFIYDACITGAQDFNRYHSLVNFRDTLEIYVTSMLNAVGYWAHKGLKNLALYHDESSAFFRQADIWAALTSPHVDAQAHPVLNGPSIKFPLPVALTESKKSENSYSVQLCDLVAGLSAKIFAGALEPEVLAEIGQSGLAQVETNGVGPGSDFPDQPPPRRVGKDAVDKMTDIIRGFQR